MDTLWDESDAVWMVMQMNIEERKEWERLKNKCIDPIKVI